MDTVSTVNRNSLNPDAGGHEGPVCAEGVKVRRRVPTQVMMSSTPRIGWGHALTSVGLLVRRGSLLVALVALAVLGLTAAAPGRASAAEWALVAPLAAFIACRVVAVGLAMVGWLVFPPEHRALLGSIAERAREGAHFS
jgi:hypothetical protein